MFGKNNNNFNGFDNISSNNIGGQLLFVFLTIAIVALLIAGIVFLIRIAQHGLTNTGFYEPFESPQSAIYVKQLQDRLEKAKQFNAALDADVDVFNQNIQDTCEIYAQVEDIYVENNSGPQSESEYQLPKDQLDKLLERRRAGTKKRFTDSRANYGEMMGRPVYECFENPQSVSVTVSEIETELVNELNTLERKIQNVKKGTFGKKADSIDTLLKFNERNISNSLKEMNKEKSRVVEGFVVMTGPALLKKADDLFNAVAQIHGKVDNQQSIIKSQKELVEEMKQTTARVSEGNITPADVSA